MNNSDFLTISEIVYHPIIVLLLNLLMISSLCLISYQICRTKLKVSSHPSTDIRLFSRNDALPLKTEI